MISGSWYLLDHHENHSSHNVQTRSSWHGEARRGGPDEGLLHADRLLFHPRHDDGCRGRCFWARTGLRRHDFGTISSDWV
jgi:hypothetical protein